MTTQHEPINSVGILFIHGAGLGGWIWEGVMKQLDVPSVAVDYSSLDRTSDAVGLADYVAIAVQQADQLNTEKVVVVAHSIGGVVGIEVCKHLGDRAAGFLAVSAAIPALGKSYISTLPFPQKLIMPLILKMAGTKPPESAIRSGLATGLPTEQVNMVVERFEPEAKRLYTDTTSNTALPELPNAYIRTTNDKEFPLGIQNASAARLGQANVSDIASGHLPMLSHPDEVVAQIKLLLGQGSQQ